jgi:tRNA (guanine26-N2/guanine27-N2)-dimethyltransferase
MEYIEIKEGKTPFLIPPQNEDAPFPPGTAPVFFNHHMALNRDLTIALLNQVRPSLYLDAMGASGVRGLRAAQECGLAVVINDRSSEAVALIRDNVSRLGLTVEVVQADTNVLLDSRRFDAIDLDPFGTPVPFLDAAVRSAGRFLFVTATDTAPLCGSHRRAGMRRYGVHLVLTEYHPEVALRVLLGFVAREAARYDCGVRPLVCLIHRHFVRLHVALTNGARAADAALDRVGSILQCTKCPARREVPGLVLHSGDCEDCGAPCSPIGPLWLGAINDQEILSAITSSLPEYDLATAPQLAKVIELLAQEPDTSTHYDYHRLAKYVGSSPPPFALLLNRIRAAGYTATRTHYSGTGLKTYAPLAVILQIIRSPDRE